MKQYCRYCAFCFEGDGFGCSNHPEGEQPSWTRNQINRPNTCPNFALSKLGAWKREDSTILETAKLANDNDRKKGRNPLFFIS